MTHHTIHTVVGHLQVLGLFLRRGDFIYKYLLMVHSHKVVRRDYLLFESSECGQLYQHRKQGQCLPGVHGLGGGGHLCVQQHDAPVSCC